MSGVVLGETVRGGAAVELVGEEQLVTDSVIIINKMNKGEILIRISSFDSHKIRYWLPYLLIEL